MKRNITKYDTVQPGIRKHKIQTHDFATKLIVSFGEVSTLKKYAISLFAFLLLLLLSVSHNLFAADFSTAIDTELTRIDSPANLNYSQRRQLSDSLQLIPSLQNIMYSESDEALESESRPVFRDSDPVVYLMNRSALRLPYVISLDGQKGYNLNDIALAHYGTNQAVPLIKASNPNLNFERLKSGDQLYLPLYVAAGALPEETGDSPDVKAEPPESADAKADQASPEETHTSEPTPTTTLAATVLNTSATTTQTVASASASATSASAVTTAAPSSTTAAASYVVSADAETIELYVKIVAAESSPSWGYDGHLMIAQTIINRAMSGWGSLYRVLTAPDQYDVYWNGRYNRVSVTDDQRRAAMDALRGSTAFDRSVVYFCTKGAYEAGSWWKTLEHKASYDNTMFFAP